MNKIIIALITTLITYNVSFAQSVFELKGKDIYIVSTTSYNSSSSMKNIPKECIRDKNGKEYKTNITGRVFHVLDVKTNGSSKKIKSVDITLVDDRETVIFRFPMQFCANDALLSMCINPEREETTLSGVVYTTNIDNFRLTYYDKDSIDLLKTKFPIGETFYAKDIAKFKDNILYTVSEYGFDEYSGSFYLSLKDNKNSNSKNTIFINANNERKGISITDLDESFIREKEILDKCQLLYNTDVINEWRDNLINKEIFWHGLDKKTLLSYIGSMDNNGSFSELTKWYEAKQTLKKFGNFIPEVGFYWIKDIIPVRYGDNELLDYKYFMIIGRSEDGSGIMLIPFVNNIFNHMSYADKYRESLEVEKQKKAEEAEARAKIEAEAEAEAEAARMAKYRQEQLAHKNNLIRKYGQHNAELILNMKVAIGFTKQMCIEAKGQPKYKRTRTTQNEVVERWTYDELFSDYDTVLSFVNDKLVQIDSL